MRFGRLARPTLALVAAFALDAGAASDPVPDPSAQIALLRTDCTDPANPPVPLENCFETMAELSDPATGWIWNTRNPSAAAPLLVDIGPGTFGRFDCPDSGGSPRNGHVTLRGAGRERTIVTGEDGMRIVDCESLDFIDLGVHATRYGVHWSEGGDSTWTDVDLVAVEGGSVAALAWLDTCPQTGEQSVHYFFGSRVSGLGKLLFGFNSGYYTRCAETWFYGGELLVDVTGAGGPGSENTAVKVLDTGDFRAFGSAVRAQADRNVTTSIYGVLVVNEGVFHMHGGIINASVADVGGTATVNASGLWAANSAFAHTPGTAYVVQAPGGTARRVRQAQSSTVQAPFLWQSGATPPTSSTEANVVLSETGQDMFVETDCDSSGDCAGAGTETHLMLFNRTLCPGSNPWFDVVTGACRQ